ncbi:alpha/beta fold hydrolase [Neptunicella marina]|uniref:Alpha/beta fold hydrolase n=1 Tax=Neptunicella marina TaxID=2125989 RepID=A0A8J6IS74_9ALTE|nr:alpha/beta fold hydrolase [Neptunicella marina]
MKYLKYWIFLTVIGTIIFRSVIAAEPQKPLIGMFDAGDAKLHLACYGNQSPTIIVHSGLGDYGSQGHWNAIIDNIQSKNRICIYDRAHTGKSDKLKHANNINDMSHRLKKVLNNANVNPPYIMVGHSYGSYPVKAYNHLYPDDVKAILLIDPSQYGMWFNRVNRWHLNTESYEGEWESARLKEDFKYWDDPGKNKAFIDIKMNESIIKKTQDFGDKPYVLLWAKNGIWDPNNSSFKQRLPKVWERTRDSYLKAIADMHKLSTNIRVVFSKTDNHYIHYVEPETVIEQLDYLLAQI